MRQNRKHSDRRKRASMYLLPVLGIVLLLVAIGWGLRTRLDPSAATPASAWRSDGLSGTTVHFLAVGHSTSSLVFAATESGVYRRETAGAWTRVLARPGVWSVDLRDDDRTVVAGDGEGNVDLSLDAGAHWQSAAVSTQAVYAVSFSPGTRRIILAGAGGGLFRSADGGAHWTQQLTLPGSAIAALTWMPESSSTVFAGAVAGTATGSTDVYVSRDAGITWHRYGPAWNNGGGIMSLVVLRNRQVLAGTMGKAAWSLAGGSWRRLAGGMPLNDDHVSGIAVVPGSPPKIFAATLGSGVYQSNDGGRHWVQSSQGLTASADSMIVLSVAYSPRASRLYAGTSIGVYRRNLTPAPRRSS